MDEKRKQYMREYMARRRKKLSGKKEAVVDNATTGTREDSPVTKLYRKISETLSAPYHPETNLSGVKEDSESIRLCGEDDHLPSQTNLSVDVQPEPEQRLKSAKDDLNISGEARAEHAKPHATVGTACGGQNLSVTDQKFDEDRPGWYIFGSITREKNCWRCGNKYDTRLEMSRFCSPKCKNDYLESAAGLQGVNLTGRN